jgi:hypothetical protein
MSASRVLVFSVAGLILLGLLPLKCARTSASKPGLDTKVNATIQLLESPRPRAVRSLTTPECWHNISACYDFALSAYSYRGTFDDFLRRWGGAMRRSWPSNTTYTRLDQQTTMLVFRDGSSAFTIVYFESNGAWRISFFSPGDIERAFVEKSLGIGEVGAGKRTF